MLIFSFNAAHRKGDHWPCNQQNHGSSSQVDLGHVLAGLRTLPGRASTQSAGLCSILSSGGVFSFSGQTSAEQAIFIFIFIIELSFPFSGSGICFILSTKELAVLISTRSTSSFDGFLFMEAHDLELSVGLAAFCRLDWIFSHLSAKWMCSCSAFSWDPDWQVTTERTFDIFVSWTIVLWVFSVW